MTKPIHHRYTLSQLFERRMVNHEKRLASRARIRAKQVKQGK